MLFSHGFGVRVRYANKEAGPRAVGTLFSSSGFRRLVVFELRHAF